jgi:hypothetical protein
MLNDSELKTFYCLFNKMNGAQINDFLKTKGLFYASFLDPSLAALNENCEDDSDLEISDYIEKCTDVNDEVIQKYLKQVENNLNQNDTVIVIKPTDITENERHLSEINNVYKVIDNNNFEQLLLISNSNVKKNIELYKEKMKKTYCASDLYNMDSTISKMLLPKMLEQFRKNTHGYPCNLTEKEWDKILLKLIWFFNEIITNQGYGCSCEESQKYNNKIIECQNLLGKYFLDLWD